MAGARPILSEEWGRSLAEALGIDPNTTSRIVIDIRPRELIKVYVEKVATEQLLNVLPPSIEWCKVETSVETTAEIEGDEQPKNEDSRYRLMRLQMAMYQGKKCYFCGHEYSSVDDMIQRDVVRATNNTDFEIACKACYEKSLQ